MAASAVIQPGMRRPQPRMRSSARRPAVEVSEHGKASADQQRDRKMDNSGMNQEGFIVAGFDRSRMVTGIRDRFTAAVFQDSLYQTDGTASNTLLGIARPRQLGSSMYCASPMKADPARIISDVDNFLIRLSAIVP